MLTDTLMSLLEKIQSGLGNFSDANLMFAYADVLSEFSSGCSSCSGWCEGDCEGGCYGSCDGSCSGSCQAGVKSEWF